MKLEWFRRHQKHFLAALAVFLMVAWGMGGSLNYIMGKRYAGKVFGTKVPLNAMINMYDRWTRSQAGRRYQGAISKDGLWESFILVKEARKMGLDVGKEEIRLAVVSDPRFMGKTGFSAEAYQRFLQQTGLDETLYEDTLEEQILISKVLMLVQSGAKVPTEEAWQRYADENEQVKVKYAALKADDLIPDMKATPEELNAFYAAHKTQFASPEEGKPGYKRDEAAQIEYIMVSKADLARPEEVTDEEIRKYYDEHKESYKIEEKKKEEPAEKKETKEEAKKEGNDEAKKKEEKQVKNEEGQTEKKKDGNASETAKEEKKAEADSSKGKEKGAKSGNEPNDPESAKAEEKKPEYRPLEQVKKEIREKLVDEKAQESLTAVMEKIDRKIEEKMKKEEPFSLSMLADELPDQGLSYVKTGFLTSSEIGILPGKLNFQKDIADFEELTPSGIMECEEGKFVYQMLSIRPAEVIPFEGVKKQVEADLKKDKALKRTIEIVEECRAKTGSFEECLKMIREKLGEKGKDLSVSESNFFTRPKALGFFGRGRHQFETGLSGDHPLFAEEAFRLKKGQIGFAVEEGAEPTCYLMALIGRKPADRDAFEKDKKTLLQRYTYDKMVAVQDGWMADLNRKANLQRIAF